MRSLRVPQFWGLVAGSFRPTKEHWYWKCISVADKVSATEDSNLFSLSKRVRVRGFCKLPSVSPRFGFSFGGVLEIFQRLP